MLDTAAFSKFGIGIALLLWRQCKTRTSFKTLDLKEATTWRLKKSQITDKLLQKVIKK